MTTTLPKRVSRGLQSWLRQNPLENLRAEMDQLINQFSADWNGDIMTEMGFPSMDLSETDKTLEVKMDVPGFKPDEIKVEVRDNTLFVSGEHREEKEEKGKRFHRVERRSGSIERSIALPAPVDKEKVAAVCRDGVLTVTLPKTADASTRKIEVKSA